MPQIAKTDNEHAHELVVRSQVEIKGDYKEYRQELRYDFFYSCAYCTMAESEATTIRYVIDHYIPRNERPDLVHSYENLIYTCDLCNMRKSDRYPPSAARDAGYRYFRPDRDYRSSHFKCEGIRWEGITETGIFTVEDLDLNRFQLRRLRELRQRLVACAPMVEKGIMALRNFQFDQLPQGMRGPAIKSIGKARDLAETLVEDIDDTLRAFAKSELADPDTSDEEKQRLEARKAKLEAIEGLFPGNWRAPRQSKSTK